MKTHTCCVRLLVILGCLLFGSNALAYYNPATGTWLSRDPIGERGGANLYAMTRNDVINRVDHLGLYDLLDPYPDTLTPDGKPTGVPPHVGATLGDINDVISALKNLEKVKGSSDHLQCYKIKLLRNVSTHTVNVAVASTKAGADITYMIGHGGFPGLKGPSSTPDPAIDPSGLRRTIQTSDGYIDVDGTKALAAVKKRQFHPYACYVYPNSAGVTGGNVIARTLAADLNKLAATPPTTCPCVKEVRLLVGPDTIRLPAHRPPPQRPQYPDTWSPAPGGP